MNRDYEWIAQAVAERINPGDDRERRMQVVVDTLWEQLHDQGVSWIGFYLKVPGVSEMALGPRRDKPACSPIGMHGVCGQGFLKNEARVVRDVKELGENYIACDPRDQSEVVVPFHNAEGRPVGVLDLDSYQVGAFDECDVRGLERILAAAALDAVARD